MPRNFAIRIVFSILILGTAIPFAWAGEPQFEDYLIGKKFNGPNAAIHLTQKDQMFQTRLKNAAKFKPNFAGHYILATWGCGTECLMGAAIDAKTGRVHWIPFTVCCWNQTPQDTEPIDFRLDSNLIVFSGARDEKEGDKGKHFYKFEKNRFVEIQKP